jgi:hypothetical protein
VSDLRPRTTLSTLLSIDAQTYHADEITDVPTLSKSILHMLIERSPAHAREQHPKLNPDFQRVDEDKFDLGTAAHALFLEGDAGVHIVYANDFKTVAAREERDLARQHGRTPLLEKHYIECERMVSALRAQCDAHPLGPFFTDGTAEKTLVWEDDYGVMCRARLDWIRDDLTAWHDLKTTRASASQDSWSRTALGIGVDLQAAFYARGCRAVLGCDPDYRFVAVETQPPYLMSVFALAPDTLALAEKKISYALKRWAMCLRNDDWPGYPTDVAYITTPPWVEAAWLERELREVTA